MLFQLGFEALEQGKGIGSATGKSRQDAALIEPTHFSGRRLDNDTAQRDLAVAAHGDRISPTHRQDRRAVILLHVCS